MAASGFSCDMQGILLRGVDFSRVVVHRLQSMRAQQFHGPGIRPSGKLPSARLEGGVFDSPMSKGHQADIPTCPVGGSAILSSLNWLSSN